jgi:TPR repeat protein
MKATYCTILIIALIFLTACVNTSPTHEISYSDLILLTESDLYSGECSNTNRFVGNEKLYSSPAAAYFVAVCLQRDPATAEKYRKAIHLLEYSVKNDYPDAAYQLSQTYSNGYGVEIDLLTAVDWLRIFDSLSKQKRNIQPILVVDNDSVKKTTGSKMLESLEKKAMGGDLDVQYLLAQAYDKGQWGDVNVERAMHWYTLSAESGNESASFMLGYFYCRGINVPQDKGVANQYFKNSNRNMLCK